MNYDFQIRLNQLNRRRRRIGVCLSMASTDILSPSPKHVSTEENMETRNELPELQVNGVHCEIDKACSDANSQVNNDIYDNSNNTIYS